MCVCAYTYICILVLSFLFSQSSYTVARTYTHLRIDEKEASHTGRVFIVFYVGARDNCVRHDIERQQVTTHAGATDKRWDSCAGCLIDLYADLLFLNDMRESQAWQLRQWP